jgi:hypothetical protein
MKREDIYILLLAAGNDNLQYRRKVKDELDSDGYSNIIIMEDLPPHDNGICFKFKEILEKYHPHLIITFFHKSEKIDVILFELGIVCSKDGIRNTIEKLRFLHDGFNFKDTTAYMRDLFLSVISFHYDDSNVHQKSAKVIDKWAKNRCKEIEQIWLRPFQHPLFIPDFQTKSK